MARIDEINAEILKLQEVPAVCRRIGAFQAPSVDCEAANRAARDRVQVLQMEALAIRGELPALTGDQIQRLFRENKPAFDLFREFQQLGLATGVDAVTNAELFRRAISFRPLVPLVTSPPPAPPPVPAPVAIPKEKPMPALLSLPAPAPSAAPSFLSSVLGAVLDVGKTVATQVVGAAVGAGTALLSGAITRAIAPVPTSGAPGAPIVVPAGASRIPMTLAAEVATDRVRDRIALAGQLQMRQSVITRSVPPNCTNPQPLLICTPRGGQTAVSPLAFRVGEVATDAVRDRIAFQAAQGCR